MGCGVVLIRVLRARPVSVPHLPPPAEYLVMTPIQSMALLFSDCRIHIYPVPATH